MVEWDFRWISPALCRALTGNNDAPAFHVPKKHGRHGRGTFLPQHGTLGHGLARPILKALRDVVACLSNDFGSPAYPLLSLGAARPALRPT